MEQKILAILRKGLAHYPVTELDCLSATLRIMRVLKQETQDTMGRDDQQHNRDLCPYCGIDYEIEREMFPDLEKHSCRGDTVTKQERTGLCGEIKNTDGHTEPRFTKAVEKLMLKYKVNYIHLYWKRF